MSMGCCLVEECNNLALFIFSIQNKKDSPTQSFDVKVNVVISTKSIGTQLRN